MFRRGFIHLRNICVRSYFTRTREPYSTTRHIAGHIDSRLIPEHDFSSFSVETASSSVAPLSEEFLGATLHPQDFGAMFHECAPYIDAHREKIIVMHIPGTIMKNRRELSRVVDDIRCLHLLGSKLVLVTGVSDPLESELQQIKPFPDAPYVKKMPVTDSATLQKLLEASGLARFSLESCFARGFRPGKKPIHVVGGNFFYSAQPVGVQYGVDFLHTGVVRSIEPESFHKCFDNRDIVLLSPVGHCPSGELFRLQSEAVASAAASALKAHKIIFLEEKPRVLVDSHQCVVSHLRLAEAQKILASRSDRGDTTNERFFFDIANCVHALKNDVNRAHVVPAGSGNLLQELYTRGGSGLVITKNVYEGMRPAEISDLDTVQEMIRPLIDSGSLLDRSRAELEAELGGMHLLSRGSNVLAVGILKEYSSTQAEICCLAARRDHGRAGSGQTVFRFLERLAMKRGVKDLFVLSTQSMQWFEERGFLPISPKLLPKGRAYDCKRGSKVYHKQLRTLQDCTAEEALWNS